MIGSQARVEYLIAGGVFAAALLVRLLFLFSSADRTWPHSIYYEGDAPEWVRYAAALDQGREYEFDLPLRSPAVAYLLHWLAPGKANRAISGAEPQSFTALKTLWCAISAMTCALAYLAFAKGLGRRVGLIAGLLCVFSFGSYIISTSLNNETLYSFFLMAIVLGWLHLRERGTIWLAIVIGWMHGLATLIRPEHTLLLLLLLGYYAWRWVPAASTVQLKSKIQNPKSKIGLLAVVVLASILICLPWSVRGALAIARLNHTTAHLPNYDHAPVHWSPEARAYLDSLPAFARKGNFGFINELMRARNQTTVSASDVEQFFLEVFGSIPEPLSPWVFVSAKGPLDFALANHPDAGGGFSKAALIRGNETDPKLMIGRPDHLRLINDGYAVGWQYITSDFGAWLRNTGSKLSNFADGLTLGFTAFNWPLGREGVRRPIDMISPEPGDGRGWQFMVMLLAGFGLALAVQRRQAGIWITIIAYKLIITVLFYGYARHAVSIAPAFFVLIAIALDQLARWMFAAIKLLPSARWIACIATIALLIGMDLAAFFTRPQLSVHPVQSLTSHWGLDGSAFESVDTIHIRFTSQPAGPIP